MALKDKFASSIAARTGISQEQAAMALREAVDLIKSRVPAQVGNALVDLLDSANGIDPGQFLASAAAQAVAKMPEGQLKVEAQAAIAAVEASPAVRGWLGRLLEKVRSLVYPGSK